MIKECSQLSMRNINVIFAWTKFKGIVGRKFEVKVEEDQWLLIEVKRPREYKR